jgi:hypothetical protein
VGKALTLTTHRSSADALGHASALATYASSTHTFFHHPRARLAGQITVVQSN